MTRLRRHRQTGTTSPPRSLLVGAHRAGQALRRMGPRRVPSLGQTEIEGLMVAARELGLPRRTRPPSTSAAGSVASPARWPGTSARPGGRHLRRMVEQARELHRDVRTARSRRRRPARLPRRPIRPDLFGARPPASAGARRDPQRRPGARARAEARWLALLPGAEPAAAAAALAAPPPPLRSIARGRPRRAAALRALWAPSHPHERGRGARGRGDRGRGGRPRAGRRPDDHAGPEMASRLYFVTRPGDEQGLQISTVADPRSRLARS